MQTNYSVPFAISGLNHGLQEAKGLMKIGEEGLDFEFEVKDTVIGVVKSGLKNIQIPYDDLVEITFKKGLIRSKIILKGTSMRVFNELPGVEVATCQLKIKRKDKREAARLVSNARVELSEFRLSQLEG